MVLADAVQAFWESTALFSFARTNAHLEVHAQKENANVYSGGVEKTVQLKYVLISAQVTANAMRTPILVNALMASLEKTAQKRHV